MAPYTLLATDTLASFWATGLDDLSDPRILFDAPSGRFFASIMDTTTLSVLVAVSTSSDPTGGWYTYTFPSNFPAQTCPDQPKIGVDALSVVITVNAFAASRCAGDVLAPLDGGQIWWVDKTAMLSGATAATELYPPNPAYTGITPVQSLTATNTEYLVAFDPHVSTVAHVIAASGAPANVSLPVNDVAIATVTAPPPGVQAGSAQTLDPGDGSSLDAVYANGVLSFSSATACIPTGDTVVEACGRVASIDPVSDTLLHWGTVGFSGLSVYYPALRPDGAGNLIVAFGYSSSTTYPSFGVAVWKPDGTWSGSSVVVSAGTGPFLDPHDATARYGDYFGAAADPSDPTRVWVAGEIGLPGGAWGTALAAVSYAESPTPTPTPSPTPTPTPTPPAGPGNLTASPATIFQGDAVAFTQSGPPNTSFSLQSTPDGVTWTTIASLATDGSGNAMYSYAPAGTLDYRSSFPTGMTPTVRVTVLSPLSSALSLTSSSGTITFGTAVSLSAQLRPASVSGANRVVSFLATDDGATWSTVGTATTDAAGGAVVSYRPSTNLTYRAVTAGDPDLPAGTSGAVPVSVAQTVLIRPTNLGHVKTLSFGTSIAFRAIVRPLVSGHRTTVTFTFYRLVSHAWKLITRRQSYTDTTGTARWTYKFTTAGSWYVRVQAGATTANAASSWSGIERYLVL